MHNDAKSARNRRQLERLPTLPIAEDVAEKLPQGRINLEELIRSLPHSACGSSLQCDLTASLALPRSIPRLASHAGAQPPGRAAARTTSLGARRHRATDLVDH